MRSRQCIAFVPSSAAGGCPETSLGPAARFDSRSPSRPFDSLRVPERESKGAKAEGWTRCPAAAAQQGDIFCRYHRDAACGIVLGLLNDQKLADDATASREMARIAGSYFARQHWSSQDRVGTGLAPGGEGKKAPAAAGPNAEPAVSIRNG